MGEREQTERAEEGKAYVCGAKVPFPPCCLENVSAMGGSVDADVAAGAEEGGVGQEQEELYEEGDDVEDVADTPNDKLLRTSRIDVMEQPESYRNNTQKEELMLQYVANFRRQFEDLYPKRRSLMLCPRNECGMRKFICTSVRPTQLPFEEIYNYKECAAFVADFIHYEPLELPTSLPQHMPSCTSVLEWQAGDCFDLAQVPRFPHPPLRAGITPHP